MSEVMGDELDRALGIDRSPLAFCWWADRLDEDSAIGREISEWGNNNLGLSDYDAREAAHKERVRLLFSAIAAEFRAAVSSPAEEGSLLRAAEDLLCSSCGAKEGFSCKTGSGKAIVPHLARVSDARIKRAAELSP